MTFPENAPKAESWPSRRMRWTMNWFFPCYRGTGARIDRIAGDWTEVDIRLPLNWRTRNYVGTIFGGSIYASCDPVYMIMLIQLLGPDYVVWDKAATVRFKKPGRTTLYARFRLGFTEVDAIRALLKTERSVDRVYTVELVDAEGGVHSTVEKTVYVRLKKS